MKKALTLFLTAAMLVSALAGCAAKPSDPDVKHIVMDENPIIVSDGDASGLYMRLSDIPLMCSDVVMVQPVGVVLDGADFDLYISFAKVRVIRSYVGSLSEGDEIVIYPIGGTSKFVKNGVPITIWQNTDARYVLGLSDLSITETDNESVVDAMKSLSLETIYRSYCPYEVVTYDGNEYARTIAATLEKCTSEIIMRSGDAATVSEDVRKSIIEKSMKNADPYQIINEDGMVVTLEAWENAIKSFTPEEWRMGKD